MEKKSFAERYRAWRDKVHGWADGHSVLGFPVRHPTLFLLIIFIVVVAVCGTCNSIARKKAVEEPTSSYVHERKKLAQSYDDQTQLGNLLNVNDKYYYYTTTISATANPETFSRYNLGSSSRNLVKPMFERGAGMYYFPVDDIPFTGKYLYVYTDAVTSYRIQYYLVFTFGSGSWSNQNSLAGTGISSVEIDGCVYYSTARSDMYSACVYGLPISSGRGAVVKYLGVRLLDANMPNDFSLTVSVTDHTFYHYDSPTGYPVIENFNINELVLSAYDEGYSAGFQSGEDAGADAVKSYYYDVGYNTGYRVGYENGQSDPLQDIVDEAYKKGYAIGKEDGYALGNSSDMTLTTLFWNVIDEPFAVIYRLLNFDVLGVNVFAFVMGIVTLGLVGFVIKLVI